MFYYLFPSVGLILTSSWLGTSHLNTTSCVSFDSALLQLMVLSKEARVGSQRQNNCENSLGYESNLFKNSSAQNEVIILLIICI